MTSYHRFPWFSCTRLFARLNYLFDGSFDVVFIIREQRQAIRSSYSTMVRAQGLTLSYGEFLYGLITGCNNNLMGLLDTYNFYEVFQEAKVNCDIVDVLVFEDLIDSEKLYSSSKNRFEELFNVPFQNLPRENQGLSYKEASALAAFNTLVPHGLSFDPVIPPLVTEFFSRGLRRHH
jgi:hypothetical protein